MTVAAVAASGGVAGFMFSSGAATASGYEPITLADTSYAIPAGALFVSPAGSDANAGTLSAPFATVGKALAVAPSGATIVLRGGTYRESLMMKRPVTLQAYPHEQPWIVGSDLVTGFTPNGSTWTRAVAKTLCDTCFPAQVIDPNYPAAGLPEQVFLDGTPLQQVVSSSAVTSGTFFYDAAHGQLVLGSDPTGHAVEVTTRAMALLVSSSAGGAAVKGIGFQRTGSTFDSTAAGMVVSSAPSATFDHDTFAWSASRGLIVYGVNNVVSNSLFLYNGSNGFHAHMADGLVFQNNRVGFSDEERFSITPSAFASEGGAKITHTWNSVIQGNVFDDNYANGLWFDVTSTNVVIANNTVVRNLGHGIAYEVSGNVIVAGNVIAQNGRLGLKISGVSHAEVWNNTIVGNGWAQLGVYEDPRTDTNPIDNAAGITYDTANVHVVNNVLVASPTSTKPVFESFDISSPRHLTTAQMITLDDHNLWSRPSILAPKILVNWQTSLTAMTRYNTLPLAQVGTGRETSSISADNVPWTTLFNNPTSDDYSPAAGSPLTQPGAPLPAAVAAAMGVASSPVGLGAPNPAPVVPPTTTTVAPTTVAPTTIPPTTVAPTTTIPPTTTTTAPAVVLPTVSVDSVATLEGGPGKVTALTFTITLSQPATSDVVVDYATADGTATAGSDYSSRSGTATFHPGVVTRHIVVNVFGDSVKEANETFTARVTNAGGATIAVGQGVGTVVNDD